MIAYLKHLAGQYFFQYLLIAVVPVWFFVRNLPGRFRSWMSAGWQTVQGRIETVNVHTINVREGGDSTADLGYSYCVDKERYAGYYSRQFLDEQAAWDYADALKGQAVLARYKPSQPEVSALRPSDQAPECTIQAKAKSFSRHLLWLLRAR